VFITRCLINSAQGQLYFFIISNEEIVTQEPFTKVQVTGEGINLQSEVKQKRHFQLCACIMGCKRCPCVLRVEERSSSLCHGQFSFSVSKEKCYKVARPASCLSWGCDIDQARLCSLIQFKLLRNLRLGPLRGDTPACLPQGPRWWKQFRASRRKLGGAPTYHIKMRLASVSSNVVSFSRARHGDEIRFMPPSIKK
jgi:hypothetical protein